MTLKFEKYENEILEKNILLTRKKSGIRNTESISSMSSISTNNDYDKLLSEKLYIEDTFVKLKLNYINQQNQLLDCQDKNKELIIRNKELERIVYNLKESLKLKNEVIHGKKEKFNDTCVTEPNMTISPKKTMRKQNSLGNMFKGLFKK